MGIHQQPRDGKKDAQTLVVSPPVRTELAGNHTDHNHGCVLAASVDLDCVAAVTPIDTQDVLLVSNDHHSPIRVNLRDLGPRREEQGTPEALVRGVAAGFFKHTGIRHGFYGRLHATCMPGTGLSSSAVKAGRRSISSWIACNRLSLSIRS